MDENSDADRRSATTMQPLWPDANISSGSRGRASHTWSDPVSQSAEAQQVSGSWKDDLLPDIQFI